MFWRILLGIGALTFILSGIDVLRDADGDCRAVTWGGRGGRVSSFTMTCHDRSPDRVEDAWSGTAAGWTSVLAGVGLTGIAAWPLLSSLSRQTPQPDPIVTAIASSSMAESRD